MTPQKIFTINELVSHIKELEPAEVKLDSISILFKVQCAVSKKNMFKKDVIFINPLNIKVNGSNKDDSDLTFQNGRRSLEMISALNSVFVKVWS